MLFASICSVLVSTREDSGYAENPRYIAEAGQEVVFYLEFVGEECAENFELHFAFTPAENFTFSCLDVTHAVVVSTIAIAELYEFTRDEMPVFSLTIQPTELASEVSFVLPLKRAVCEDTNAVIEMHPLDRFGNLIHEYCSEGAIELECTCACDILAVQLQDGVCIAEVKFELLVFSKAVEVAASVFGKALGKPAVLTVRFGSSSSVWLSPLIGVLLVVVGVLGYWLAFLRRDRQNQRTHTDIQ